LDQERLNSKRDDILERQSLVFIQYKKSWSWAANENERTLGLPQG